MNANITVWISILCTIITSIISFLSYKNNIRARTSNDISDRVKRDTTITTKLDMVISGTADLKNEIKNINDKFDEINERVARCEERTKNAHERIDRLESKNQSDIC